MKTLGTILTELVGLFVDDGSLAFGVLLVVGWAAILALMANAPSWISGAVLLGGCILVLVENILRSKRRS